MTISFSIWIQYECDGWTPTNSGYHNYAYRCAVKSYRASFFVLDLPQRYEK